MGTMEQIGLLTPKTTNPHGSLLLAGSLTVTVTSRGTGDHVTLTLRPSQHGDDTVPFGECTHVAIEDYDGARLATYFPSLGEIAWKPRVEKREKWSVLAVLRVCSGDSTPTTFALFDAVASFA